MGQRPGPSSKDPLIGQTFAGRYVIDRRLGQGGMAVVYAAHDRNLQRDVAVKILRPDVVDSERAAQRLKREARAVGRLHHRHIITFHDVGMADDHIFIVMEQLTGRTLAEERRTLGRLPFQRACAICAQVAEALRVVHDAGIVHRDLKPDNVFLVDRRGADFCKLLDFSIAKLPTTMVDGQITVTGTVFGTPHYMSPEQAMGDPVSAATDLYALGAILFELVTGRTPFVANNPVELVTQQGLRPAPRARDLHPRLPAELDALIASMLEKSPRDRPASARDAALALVAASKLRLDDPPPPTEDEIPPPPPRRPPRKLPDATLRGSDGSQAVAVVSSPSAVFTAVTQDDLAARHKPPVKPPPKPVAPDPSDPYQRETQPTTLRPAKPFGRTQPATNRAMRSPFVAPRPGHEEDPDDLPPTDHGQDAQQGRARVETRRPTTGSNKAVVVAGPPKVRQSPDASVRVTSPRATPAAGRQKRATIPSWQSGAGKPPTVGPLTAAGDPDPGDPDDDAT